MIYPKKKIEEMQISEHFSMDEFCISDTAKRLGIANLPDQQASESLVYLVRNLLEPLRRAYGKPLHINSGYRCPALNRAVGGVSSSQHLKGEAADISCDDPVALLQLLRQTELVFDQAILYPTFLHVSLRRQNNRQRIIIKKKIDRYE